MEIVHLDRVLRHVVAEFVGFAVRDARLDAAAGHPHRERARVVVAPQELRSVARLVHRRAAELAAPHDQRRVEQAARLEVRHERRGRLVRLAAQVGQLLDDVLAEAGAVGIPTAVVELHEPHAAFHQSTREQAVVGKRGLSWLRAVEVVDRLGLAGDVGELGHARLHPVGEFVRVDACLDLRVAHTRLAQAVQILQGVERLPPQLRVHAVGVGDEQHGVGAAPELDALVDTREEARTPARLAAVGVVLAGNQHDERGEVLAVGSESVREPRPHARAANHLVPGVHEDLRRRVIELRRLHRLHDGDVVGDGGQVRQEVGDLLARLAVPAEVEWRAEDLGCALDEGEALALDDLGRNVLPVVLAQGGLVIEEVELRRRARHEQEDDLLGLWRH